MATVGTVLRQSTQALIDCSANVLSSPLQHLYSVTPPPVSPSVSASFTAVAATSWLVSTGFDSTRLDAVRSLPTGRQRAPRRRPDGGRRRTAGGGGSGHGSGTFSFSAGWPSDRADNDVTATLPAAPARLSAGSTRPPSAGRKAGQSPSVGWIGHTATCSGRVGLVQVRVELVRRAHLVTMVK